MIKPLSRASTARLLAAAAVLMTIPFAWGQTPASKDAAAGQQVDRGSAYYHYGLAHMYEDLAVSAGRPDYASQAIEEYKLAMDADPESTTLQDGLAELYFKLGRIREAVNAAQAQVIKNPQDVAAHELLGKIYLRSLGDMQGQQSAQMLKLAIAEYEKLAELKPKDVETRLLLGQLYGLNHDSAKAESEFKDAQKIDADSEEVVLNLYRLYTEQADYARAVDILKSIPEDDRSARIDFALGATYDQLKKPKEAIAAYRRALDDDPDNLDTQRGLATALLRDGQLDEALKIFKTVVAAEPQDAQSMIKIADIQRQQGHYEDALATLEKAKPLSQDNLELSYNEALVYDTLGRYDDAIRTLKSLIDSTSHPDGTYSDQEKQNRAIFLDRLGIIYREQDKTTESVAAYKQMVALGGDFAKNGYQGEVDSYRDAHQWEKSTAAAAEAAKAMPKDQGVQLMYAGQLADTGKVDEGIALAKSQISATGDQKGDREAHLALANIYIRLKRWPEATKELSVGETLSKAPDEKLYAYFLRGVMADRQKQYDAAEAQFRKALAIDPQNATILNYLGYMLADRGVRLSEALTMIRKAVELDPQNYAYLDSLGWAYYKTGQYALAEDNVRKANERNSGDPTIHDHLAEIYERTGKLKQAVEQWERSLNEYARSLPADADPEDVAKVQHKLDNARVKLSKLNTSSVK
ncbi:tetratricopeptide repeat protein [Edaphobacter sp. 12200R-103]|jgi:tetratricopeptide (TPR) repeat protein|uniref:tetratricopeptide repeat protein n=1 Tax=Edaphobacter sp. 12200R-103 TaxID=2703788 RepID=UPI00138C4511|nr:tetratricopeptide repeat protein [Edaphobacter sp. 12200R-103]QHS51086.1 tetratricopeptide repeat protein [Edaphobacter sp. 12200R-103]